MKNLRLLILYFSGTGNTHYVAEYLSAKLEHLPLQIRLRSVEQGAATTGDEFDILTVGFPVYACEAPSFFRDYLCQLPPGEGRGAFVFCTKGAYAGGVARRSLQRLASRGYVPLGAASVGMPGTDGLAFVSKNSWFARQAQNKDFDHLKSVDELARRMEEMIEGMLDGGSARDYRISLTAGIGTHLSRVSEWLWQKSYELFTEPFKRRFHTDERCNHCQLCVRICPSGNISFDGEQIHFADRCYLCMRCVHQCPQEAIQIGRATVDKFRWSGPKGSFKPLQLYGEHRTTEEEYGTVH